MKALVIAFYKEKTLVGLLRDCEIFADLSFQLYYLCI